MAFKKGEYDAKEIRATLKDIEKAKRGDLLRFDSIRDEDGTNFRLDIRNYFVNKDDELSPTQKGVRLKQEELVDVIPLIVAAMDEDARTELLSRLK